MTSDDLRHLLQTVATQGTDSVELVGHSLVPRIRQRRRRRAVFTGVAGLATAAVIAIGASAVLPGGGTETTVVNRGGPVVTEFPAPPFRCGVAFPTPASIGTSRLKLTQQTMATSPDGWAGSVQAHVTNTFDKRLVGGLPPRQVAVVQENRVVGHAVLTVTERPVEIRPGQTHTSTVPIDIRSCDSARLPVGSYLLYEDLTDSGKPTSASMVENLPLAQIQLN